MILLIALLAGEAPAQEILTIGEKDRDGNYRDKDNPGEIKPEFVNNRISDINSVLDIRINLDAVNRKVGEFYEERLPVDLAKKISLVRIALEQRNQSLTRIEAIVKSYDYNLFKIDIQAYDRYISSLAAEAQALLAIINIDPRIKEEYFKAASTEDRYTAVYIAAAKVLPDLEDEFRRFARESGIYIQFGGWLVTKHQNVPIHLEGFDDIAPQTPYEVDRWQFIPTDDQIKELEQLQELAKKNRDLGLSILKITAQNQLEALKALGNMKLQQLAEKLDTELVQVLTRFGQSIEPELRAALDSIKALPPAVKGFAGELEARLKYYENIIIVKDIDVEEFLSHAQSDVNFITRDEGPALLKRIESAGKQIKALEPRVRAMADSTVIILKKLEEDFASEYRSIKAFAGKKASEIIYGVELDMAALEFGEEVYKLTLTDLAESTELDLVNTGIRTDGDRLVLKMTVSDKNAVQARTLETREIYLFRVLPHVITTVGVVFADPLAQTAIQTQFQMAPSCNFLFKGLGDQKCRRKSVAYNRLFDWGLGLHLSAPDFDKDDVPEIAAGVVVSTLHDYLQCGFAFNVFTGDPYWFFGLRFPVPTFNIGASGQAQVE